MSKSHPAAHKAQIDAYLRIHSAGNHTAGMPATEADWIAVSQATKRAFSEYKALAAVSAEPVAADLLTAILCSHIDSTLTAGQTRADVLWRMSMMLAGKVPQHCRPTSAFEWLSS